MSYQSQAALSFDAAFRDRSLACCKEQSLIFKDDQRPEFNEYETFVLEARRP